MEPLIPLHLLHQGQSAEIGHLHGAPEEVHRLEELGLRQGRTIHMVRAGQPCIIRIGGHNLCFRGAESFGVFVRSRAAS